MAIVIRNAGDRFAPAASDPSRFGCLPDFTQIIILQHKNCSSTFVTNDEVLDYIRAKRPEVTRDQFRELETRLLMRSNDESGLVMDLQYVRECLFLKRGLTDSAVGLYLDVDTGLVKKVEG